MSGFRILEPGLHTTIQDLGRFGLQRYGVPVSGALDPEALRLANALVGAEAGAAGLELRHFGPTFEVVAEGARIAVVGAEIAGTLTRDGEATGFGADRTVTLRAGDRVKIGPLRGSSTASLAIAGGLDVPPMLGARATFTRSRLGGLDGRALTAGTWLPLAAARAPEGPDLALPPATPEGPARRIRVVLGPQADHFTPEAVETFLSAEWTVTNDADRMGMRLAGPKLAHARGWNITSDGIVGGAIQVPGTGLPIVLLADRQTSGGYPKIAAVITADLPALGRLSPGARFGFAAVTAREGVAIARARDAALRARVAGIGPWRPAGALDLEALYRGDLISPPIGMD